MKRRILIFLFVAFSTIIVFPQDDAASPGESTFKPDVQAFETTPGSRVMLAITTPDYPVTPGDVYKLTYIRLNEVVSADAIVSSDFTLNLNLFGSLNAGNITYSELKNRIEKIIVSAYPGSKPQVLLQSTGIFTVLVKGEVMKSDLVQCWGLTRLSDVIREHATAFSSIRNINIISSAHFSDTTGISSKEMPGARESVKTYDLFSAQRDGNLEQNPLIKPGDTIVVKKAERQVTLSGAVYRQGKYQLFENENLKELIFRYGDGFTGTGNRSKISINRKNPQPGSKGEILYVDAGSPLFETFVLNNFDEVNVPALSESLPFVYFEGAINLTVSEGNSLTSIAGRIRYRLTEGELLSGALRKIEKSFSPLALLEQAVIVREGEKDPIAVNLVSIIQGDSKTGDIRLKPADRIVIPFKQFFVIVSGAVHSPGHYPYIAGRTYEYYIDCAGGWDPLKNTDKAVIITDSNDKVKPIGSTIQPEDRIFAETNNLTYQLNQWIPAIQFTISIAALIISILQLAK
jgi:polysaccharide export outer membrane protein